MTPDEYQAARDARKAERVGRLVLWAWEKLKELGKGLIVIAALDAIAFIMCGYIGR